MDDSPDQGRHRGFDDHSVVDRHALRTPTASVDHADDYLAADLHMHVNNRKTERLTVKTQQALPRAYPSANR